MTGKTGPMGTICGQNAGKMRAKLKPSGQRADRVESALIIQAARLRRHQCSSWRCQLCGFKGLQMARSANGSAIITSVLLA
jgi:hypothetical protein